MPKADWKSEAQVTAEVKKYLESLPNCWFFKVHGSAVQLAGVPDIVGLIRGEFFAIELKEEDPSGRKATPLQAKRIEDIKRAGGIAFVARSLGEVKEFIQ